MILAYHYNYRSDMTDLNQNLEGKDVPNGQLPTVADFPAKVQFPDASCGNYSVMYSELGCPHGSRIYFDSLEDARKWAKEKACQLGVELRK